MTTHLDTSPIHAPLDLGDGRLWLLGGLAPITERFSWLRDTTGWEPMNCYLLLEDDGALLVDTGVTAHGGQVDGQLDQLIGRERPLSLYVTRIELDTVSGMGEIIRNFNVTGLYAGAGFGTNPMEFFDHLYENPLVFHRRGHRETISVGADREFVVLNPVLRLLHTTWGFDPATGTLFTSDAFSHLHLPPSQGDPDGAGRLVTQSNDTSTPELVTDHLLVKFEWLKRLQDPEYVAEGVASVFDDYDVTTIAPTHGCVIQGRELVQQHKDWLIDAIMACPTGE